MKSRILMLLPALYLLMAFAAMPRSGFAQGGVTATLSGTVMDSSGAVVPGATVTAKNKATASISTAVSGADGLFTIPALEPGDAASCHRGLAQQSSRFEQRRDSFVVAALVEHLIGKIVGEGGDRHDAGNALFPIRP